MPTTTQTGGLSSQTLEGADGADNTDIIYGDANKLKGTTVVGDDTIIGGDDGAINYLYGDAYSIEGKSKGGADTIIGGSNGATNYIYGDAYSMQGKVKGGNDILFGGLDSTNKIYGDAYNMRDGVIGGDDEISIDNLNRIFILSNSEFNYSNSNNYLIGDAFKITESVGGKDFISMSNDLKTIFSQNQFSGNLVTKANLDISNNMLIGDSIILNNSNAGDDVLNIANNLFNNITFQSIFSSINNTKVIENSEIFIAKDNIVVGDSEMMLESKGGNDKIEVFNKFFDGKAELQANSQNNSFAELKSLTNFSILNNQLFGDAHTMSDSKGGDDIIKIGNDFISTIFSVRSLAGNNSIAKNTISTSYTLKDNNLYGDAETMNHSTGGNDQLAIGNDFVVSVVGPLNANSDASSTATISISTAFLLNNNNLFGDAESMNHSKGGDDTLSIGVGILDDPNLTLDVKDNSLYGDAKTMSHSQGGNDKLTGADGRGSVTYLYGDAQFTDGHSKAGDDVLTSGHGNDQMWGDFASVLNPATSSNDHDHEDDDGGYGWDEHELDHDEDHHASNPYKYAGKDTFVFKENNGNDTIFDFQHGLDKIDLSAANIFSVDGLHIEQSAAHPSDTVIDLGGGNSITLVGVSNVVETDFVFAGISI